MKNVLLSIALFILLQVGTKAQMPANNEQIADTFAIPINDEILEAKVRTLINKPEGKIQYHDVKNIRSIVFNYIPENELHPITDISALRYFTALQTLSLSGQGIRNTEPISGLKNLNFINLNSNRITDLSFIGSIGNLKTLLITNNLISDISALSRLPQITRLELDGNSIVNVGVLNLLHGLVSLRLNNNPQIRNIDTLQYMNSNIMILEIKNCNIKDLNFLKNKKQLQRLIADNNQIESIEPLLELRNLATLLISENQIKDLKPLQKMFENGCFYGKPNYFKKCHIDLAGNPGLDDAANFDAISFLQQKNVKINL